MDNLNDWLYVIFLVIAAVSGLFSGKKKKKEDIEVLGQPGRKIVPEEKQASEKGFWEILQEMQKETPSPMEAPKKKKQKKQQPVAAPTTSPFLTAESSIPNSIAKQAPMSAFAIQEEKSILDECDFHDITELKKAIVYSEIFNRKY